MLHGIRWFDDVLSVVVSEDFFTKITLYFSCKSVSCTKVFAKEGLFASWVAGGNSKKGGAPAGADSGAAARGSGDYYSGRGTDTKGYACRWSDLIVSRCMCVCKSALSGKYSLLLNMLFFFNEGISRIYRQSSG